MAYYVSITKIVTSMFANDFTCFKYYVLKFEDAHNDAIQVLLDPGFSMGIIFLRRRLQTPRQNQFWFYRY